MNVNGKVAVVTAAEAASGSRCAPGSRRRAPRSCCRTSTRRPVTGTPAVDEFLDKVGG